METLFINGSPNPEGNTAALAAALLERTEYTTLNLVDYRLYSYGQTFQDDQFREILASMKRAHLIVIGSPVYWHNVCGAVKNLMDRFYGPVPEGSLFGQRLAFLFQGAAPETWMLERGDYSMGRFARMYGMSYLGMATNIDQAHELVQKI